MYKLCQQTNVQAKRLESGCGSGRFEKADPDPDLDKNCSDQQYCSIAIRKYGIKRLHYSITSKS
jgi:hypothetical protein